MGYGIMPYRIAPLSFAEWYGQKNKNVKTQVIKTFKNKLDSLDENFPEADGWKSCAAILDEYCTGTFPRQGENTAKHWYIVEIMVLYFNGVFMDNSEWSPCRTPPFHKYPEFKAGCFEAYDDIPLGSPNDFPAVFTVDTDNYDALFSVLRNDPDFSEEQIKQFESWIEEADLNFQYLLFFYY